VFDLFSIFLCPDSEESNRNDEKALLKKPWCHSLLKVLIKGSSMAIAESEAVKKLEPGLQIEAISDLVINSTDPAVSNIALEALSGCHVHFHSRNGNRIPDHLISRIVDTLQELKRTGDYSTTITRSWTAYERLLRAGFLRPDAFPIQWRTEHFQLLSKFPSGSPRMAGLDALSLQSDWNSPIAHRRRRSEALLEWLFSNYNLESAQIPHPWVYLQTLKTLCSGWNSGTPKILVDWVLSFR
jgi:hypothetical protein